MRLIFPYNYPQNPPRIICKQNVKHNILDDQNMISKVYMDFNWHDNDALYKFLNSLRVQFNETAPRIEKDTKLS